MDAAESSQPAALLNLSIFEVNKVAVQLAEAQRSGDFSGVAEAARELREAADGLDRLAELVAHQADS
ncbi:hypothetical protein [Amycolatopsis saalfeldensis]|uniref:hypothetical protein n=1 Tax=Amycolatopsis saalfeldensis TaxID=394193 RepID=UPI001160BEB5|nr:hypothetical protein [Amycolatopsis saalfeldensis]